MCLWKTVMPVIIILSGFFAFGEESFPARKKPLPVTEFYKRFKPAVIADEQGALFGPRVYLGTAGTPAHYNTLTLGWGAAGVLWGKPAAIVYIRENRFSYRYFERFPVFVLSCIRKNTGKRFTGSSGGNQAGIRTRKNSRPLRRWKLRMAA